MAREEQEKHQRTELLHNLRKRGVDIVLISDETRAVMVGSRTLRVGDVLDGFIIAEINNDGIVLAEPNASMN